MAALYDEIDIADFTWSCEERTFFYPCPCGDRFSIRVDDMLGGEDVAGCPSCSLRIRILFDEASLDAAMNADAAAPPAP